MKPSYVALLAIAQQAAAHATFQQLWVDGCNRPPQSNSPVTSLGSADTRCNVGGARGVGGKCPVSAGSVVTVEMHQQTGDRSCSNEAIGGAHYGPVLVYLSKVTDASTADGSTPWFKVYENSWAPSGGAVGDLDYWGTKDMNTCCGRVDVRLPPGLPSGDYLLRAEAIALHALPAQLYMSCYQITISGGSSSGSVPAGVSFPGAYSSSDPGLTANIHAKMTSYQAPGPAVVSGGTKATAGNGCSGGCQQTCSPGSGPSTTLVVPEPTGGGPGGGTPGGCEAKQWEQCGGIGFTGCTNCAAGTTCNTSNDYYHQCV